MTKVSVRAGEGQLQLRGEPGAALLRQDPRQPGGQAAHDARHRLSAAARSSMH